MMEKKTDILVYIALAEEFEYVIETFSVPFKDEESKTLPLTYYIGEIPGTDKNGNKKDYKVTLVPAGVMGNIYSAAVVSSLIDEFKPSDVIVIGISGSLTKDLSPSDILIPSRVDDYMANSAGIGESQNEYQYSGNYYPCDARLLNRFGNFKYTHKESYKQWEAKTKENLEFFVKAEMLAKLEDEEITLPSQAKLFAGDDRSLASGPTVGKGIAFGQSLKSKVDRKLAAIEMESAGVLAAALIKIDKPRVLVIRGISDPATDKKTVLEAIAGDNLRKVCIKNAVELLQTAIMNGLFRSESEIGSERKPEELPLIKKVFVIGGVTGESDEDIRGFEPDVLQKSSRAIGKELAKAGVELIVCSPYDDSADYYAVSGYADAANKGIINFHYPAHEDVISRKAALEKYLITYYNDDCPRIIDWQHPTYPNKEKETIQQAWLLCQLQALEQADAVVSLGGRPSNSASTLLHLAEIWKLPIIPFTFLGGASRITFDRIKWKERYPSVSTDTMKSIDGPKKVVSLLSQLMLDNLQKSLSMLTKVSRIFISRARQDSQLANDISYFLKQKNLEVIQGEETISPDRTVLPTIEEHMHISQLVIVLWSKNYALSPWCYDELMFAINRQKSDALNILIFNIDNTAIIPTEARNLEIIPANSASNINRILTKTLNLD